MANEEREVTVLGITTTGCGRVDDEQYLANGEREVTILGITKHPDPKQQIVISD
ncbi:hypothetical protein [Enterococcus quebecensis]|uniref:hypothetical protein n=1 Tax=Enterococcus quebecensis TaxID=903983 RepID=UPI000913202E|nr:hypothetical protein [Enterococcus quebecensis]OJG71461.1 hypothetical protein RV12_GL001535 [Enterococcus quebecensis]